MMNEIKIIGFFLFIHRKFVSLHTYYNYDE
jgi:hypothetical protein